MMNIWIYYFLFRTLSYFLSVRTKTFKVLNGALYCSCQLISFLSDFRVNLLFRLQFNNFLPTYIACEQALSGSCGGRKER